MRTEKEIEMHYDYWLKNANRLDKADMRILNILKWVLEKEG